MSHSPGPSSSSLARVVNRVGDRIGLNYTLDRTKATQQFIENKIEPYSEIGLDKLKTTTYALSEKHTLNKQNKNKKQERKDRRQKKDPFKLNARKRKELYTLARKSNTLKYSIFEKINKIWRKYFIAVTKEGGDALRLFRMDLHGCKLHIEASKNPSLVGHEGIVVQETKNTFIIIKQNNKTFIVPKKDSIFNFVVDNVSYRVYGSSLLFTAQNRTKAKFKQKKADDDI